MLDTWFSSALWPEATLGWPEKTASLAYFYPTSVLVTSRDIITLWVARMVIMGLYNMKEVPFAARLRAPKTPGRLRADDVEVERERRRSARPVRQIRHRCRAVHDRLVRRRDAGRAPAGELRVSALRRPDSANAGASKGGSARRGQATDHLSQVQEDVAVFQPLVRTRLGGAGRPHCERAVRVRPQLLQQIVERGPVCCAQPRKLHSGAGAAWTS